MCRERTASKFDSFMNSEEWIVKVRYNISSNGICPIWRVPGGCFSIKFTLEAMDTHLSLCQWWRADLRTATWGLLHFRAATKVLITAFSSNSLHCLLKKKIISLTWRSTCPTMYMYNYRSSNKCSYNLKLESLLVSWTHDKTLDGDVLRVINTLWSIGN